MVVCNRDRWVTEKIKLSTLTSLQSLWQRWWSVTKIGGWTEKLHKQKSKQLVFYFLLYFLIYLHIDYKCLLTFAEYPKRTSRWGLQISEKERKELRVWTPFEPVEGWGILCLFGQHLPFTCEKPVTNQQALLAGNYRKLKKFVRQG